MTTTIKLNSKNFDKKLNDLARDQMPFAAARALTLTAKDAQKLLKIKMKSVFDRPTPYILNSTRIRPAKKRDLKATVLFKNESFKSQAPSEYMLVHTKGGTRPDKRSEKLLRSRGLLPNGYQAVPGAGVRLNRYGNVTRGQIQKVLSNIGAQFDRAQNTTTKQKQYFVGSPGGAPLGVWERKKNNRVSPIFIFVKREPRYRAIFPFEQAVQSVVRTRLQLNLKRSLQIAVATAKTKA